MAGQRLGFFLKRVVAYQAGLLLLNCCLLLSSVSADVFDTVPEVTDEGYQLVYTLPIQNQAGYLTQSAVPYTVDNSASISGPFDRVAYYLELDNGKELVYAYVSFDAHTDNLSHIGLPVLGNGVAFQQYVANLNVFSNASGLVTGTGIATGNIEFWPNNYGVANQGGVPNANGSTYDFGDERAIGGSYGSFQVHNYGAGQTIMAYNRWGGINPTASGDLGIGNAPTANTDWTFAENAGDYVVKNLQVLVRPVPLAINGGLNRAVFQRDDQDQGTVPISGLVENGVTEVQARAIPRPGDSGHQTNWITIDSGISGNEFAGQLRIFSGWYDLQIRALNGSSVVGLQTVERVGAGEVFVIAGQSNSANHGSSRLFPDDDRVSAFDLSGWRLGFDPQPIATGAGGTPWPALGDALAETFDVPVGFVSVGWGGTSVGQWVPGADGPDAEPLYERLRSALQALGPHGARAVLWHQGESDHFLNTSTADYAARLQAIISQSRVDAGFDIPWGIAQATYVPSLNPTTNQDIQNAQALVANSDPLNFQGAFTDDMVGTEYRAPDLIHFNGNGLQEHADRWHAAITDFFMETSVPVQAVGSKFLDGMPVAGALPDLWSSDDVDWLLEPNATKNPVKQKIDLILVAENASAAATRLQFCLEGAMQGGPSGDVVQTIRLWNFTTNSWELVDLRAAPVQDERVVVESASEVSQLIQPITGEVIARITLESPSFSGSAFMWSYDLDQAVWLVEE